MSGHNEIKSESSTTKPAKVTGVEPPPTSLTVAKSGPLPNYWSRSFWNPLWTVGTSGGSVMFDLIAKGPGVCALILSSKIPTSNPGAYVAPAYSAGVRADEGNPGAAFIGKGATSGSEEIGAFLSSNKNFTWPTEKITIWVKYDSNGVITIGTDQFIDQNVLTCYSDPSPITNVRFFGFVCQSKAPINITNIIITPKPAPSYHLIDETIPAPDPNDYTTLRIKKGTVKEPFNGKSLITKKISISGMSLNTTGTPSTNLLLSLSGNNDIKELDIYADTLTITQTLKFPETKVSIYARELVFSGSAASIVTTPNFVQSTPAVGKTGAKGLKGGDVTLNIHTFSASKEAEKAFDLTGAAGQPGGPGHTPITPNMSGTKHNPFYPEGGPSSGFGGKNVVYYHYTYKDTENYPPENESKTDGKKIWPKDGANGQAAGIPGDGGDGGNFTTSVDIRKQLNKDIVILNGGKSGPKGKDTPGGKPGNPNPAY